MKKVKRPTVPFRAKRKHITLTKSIELEQKTIWTREKKTNSNITAFLFPQIRLFQNH